MWAETATDEKCLGGLEREDAAKDRKREREREKSWRERKWGGGDGVSGSESAREGEREREREREGGEIGRRAVGGRPSEIGEAAKPPSCFGLPEPFAVRFGLLISSARLAGIDVIYLSIYLISQFSFHYHSTSRCPLDLGAQHRSRPAESGALISSGTCAQGS